MNTINNFSTLSFKSSKNYDSNNNSNNNKNSAGKSGDDFKTKEVLISSAECLAAANKGGIKVIITTNEDQQEVFACTHVKGCKCNNEIQNNTTVGDKDIDKYKVEEQPKRDFPQIYC